MKKLLLIASFAVVGAANAVTFTNSQLSSDVPTTSVDVISGNSIKRVFTNFVLTANVPTANVAWVFDFDTMAGSNPVPAYSAVKFTVRGTLTGAQGGVFGTEYVFNTMNAPVQAGNGLLVGAATPGAWALTTTIALTPAVTKGQVQKDIFFAFDTATGGGMMQIDEIEQEFTPVPEPATMAGLALGGLALLRRRRKA